MFPSTLPVGAPDLTRVSDFHRYLHRPRGLHRGDPHDPLSALAPTAGGAASAADASGPPGLRSTARSMSRLGSLSPSLMQDLQRFERERGSHELLEVIAASLRHGCSLLIHLNLDGHVLPLTVFAVERLVHCPLTPEQLQSARLSTLSVLQVEPAVLRPPGGTDLRRAADPALVGPLDALTWALALRGARDTLLPELAGSAAYRATPAGDLVAPDLPAALAAAIVRLRREATNLREMAEWPGFDRERACRLLNGLYLQSALIVSRAHPAATNEGWRGSPPG
jgi:hypothetical protein